MLCGIVQEFYEFTKSMTKSGPDTFFKRVGTSAVLRTAFIPGVTHLLQRVAPLTPSCSKNVAYLRCIMHHHSVQYLSWGM